MHPANHYRTSEKMKEYLKRKEKLVLRAYPDPKTGGDPWTVGYGATGKGIGPGTIWTESQANDAFEEHVALFERIVQKNVFVDITQGMFDALVSITFNVGPGSKDRDGIMRLKNGNPSTLIRKLNAGDYNGAALEFPKWKSPGSNVERGLLIRRNEEVSGFWDV